LGQAWIRLRERLLALEDTLKAYAGDLNDYLSWRMQSNANPYVVDLVTISFYIKDMSERTERRGQRRRFGRQKSLEPATMYRRITTLRQWFDYLVDSEVLRLPARS
jgi:site-specific recombinase XerD